VHLHSLLSYSHAHRAVLKLRDQKQLDLEELTEYLSGVTAERDRLSAIISGHAGSSGLGLSAYLRDKMDAIRGTDDDRSRVEKMKKLDAKIKEVSGVLAAAAPYLQPEQLTEAVTTAHETSDTFSNETLREQVAFQYAKEAEMKEMLSNLADGQIELYRNVSDIFPCLHSSYLSC
jgi:sorting nexin-4